MKSRILCLAASMLCALGWNASAQTLSVGDDAPPIQVSKWVKGEKVDKLEADRTYVVEFWATWCGPCRTSIPHLTDLQKKYKAKRLQFVGVSVWEQDPSLVAPFVEEMGAKMDYSVAMDDLAGADKGKMADKWMTASGSDGIPTAFIVTKGKVAWIGHPMEMDATLSKVAAGDFDMAKAISEGREKKALEGKMMEVVAKLQKLGRTGTVKQRLAIIDQAITETPSLEKELGMQKYIFMAMTGDEGASAYGQKLIDGTLKDEVEALNTLAWTIVDPESRDNGMKRDFKLALTAATRSSELAGNENGAILDTLALAQFETGQIAKAVVTQEKAVKLSGDQDPGVKERLEKYRKALADEKKP